MPSKQGRAAAAQPCPSQLCITCASVVSPPTRVARMSSAPLQLTVPLMMPSPVCLATGTLSPVTIDSSTWVCPCTTSPSAGMRAPGSTCRTEQGKEEYNYKHGAM